MRGQKGFCAATLLLWGAALAIMATTGCRAEGFAHACRAACENHGGVERVIYCAPGCPSECVCAGPKKPDGGVKP